MLLHNYYNSLGLDIGDRSIKVAAIVNKKDFKGQERLILTSYNEVRLNDNYVVSGEIKNPSVVAFKIKECINNIKGKKLQTKTIIASLPENQCYFKTISATEIGRLESKKSIKELFVKNFPLEEEQYYFDWKQKQNGSLVIGATSKNISDSYALAIEQADFIPLTLEIESFSIARALISSSLPANHISAILTISATRSSLIVATSNEVLITLNVSLSGMAMTKEIARVSKLKLEEAERLKLKCGMNLNKCPKPAQKAIYNVINNSKMQIKKAVEYINRRLGKKINTLYLAGGVANMNKITAVLSAELKIKIIRANPLTNISIDKKLKIDEKELLRYSRAIGLAMRGAKNSNNINL